MYPSDRFDSGAILSSVNYWDPDIKTYPEYSKLQALEVNISAGDIVLVPQGSCLRFICTCNCCSIGWWHAVYSDDYTVSVSIRHMSFIEHIINGIDRIKEWAHMHGYYKTIGNCVCHSPGSWRDSLLNDSPGEPFTLQQSGESYTNDRRL